MYVPPHFREERIPVLHGLMRDRPFATLVTQGASGLVASHIPLELNPEPAPYGTLRGHLARANPQGLDPASDQEALVIFSGPHAYISPSWYAEKQATGRVVPTWNYVTVHAYGRLRAFDDRDRLLALVRALTERHEAGFDAPWAVEDAPEDFVGHMLKGIVGFELPITRLEGKWKISQNRNAADRAGVIAGLRKSGRPDDVALAGLTAETLDD